MAEVKKKTVVQTKTTKDKTKLKTIIADKKTLKAEAVVSVQTAKQAVKKSGVSVDIYDQLGKVVGNMDLPQEIFGVKVNTVLVAQAVRVYLANQRAGSASTKTRGEVQGSTRKIYRQKGTGRARHGGVRAPIFVHGGIAHGPKPRDFSLKLSQQMKRAALFSTLSAKIKSGDILVVTGVETIAPKTQNMAKLFTALSEKRKNRKVLFVLDSKHDNVIRAVRNLEGVTYEFARQLHAYEVLNSNKIVFMKGAIEEVEKTFLKKTK